jgi:very-short-patch-repair endonuclease
MDIAERVKAHLLAHAGVLTTAEAARLGITTNGLRALVRQGRLRRAVRGSYVGTSFESALDDDGRHLLLVRAILRAHPGEVAASHQSAAAAYGLPVLAADLRRAHVAHRRSTKETKRHVTHTVHRRQGDGAVRVERGLHVVSPELAVLGTAVLSGPESGIMVTDAALRSRLTTKQALADQLELMRHTPGLASARLVVRRASPTAESGGESLSRLVLEDLGHRVVPQHRIVRSDGAFVARVDFWLPELGVVVEFDGMVKYAGADGPAALAAEKRREDAIRRLGYGVARLVWADLFSPARVRAIVADAAASVSRNSQARDPLHAG